MLVTQFLERAGVAGGEEWIRSCLALPSGHNTGEVSDEHSGGVEQTVWDSGLGAQHSHAWMMGAVDPAEEVLEVRRQEGVIPGEEEVIGGSARGGTSSIRASARSRLLPQQSEERGQPQHGEVGVQAQSHQ